MRSGPRLLKQNPQNSLIALNIEKLQAIKPSRDEKVAALPPFYKQGYEEQLRSIND